MDRSSFVCGLPRCSKIPGQVYLPFVVGVNKVEIVRSGCSISKSEFYINFGTLANEFLSQDFDGFHATAPLEFPRRLGQRPLEVINKVLNLGVTCDARQEDQRLYSLGFSLS